MSLGPPEKSLLALARCIALYESTNGEIVAISCFFAHPRGAWAGVAAEEKSPASTYEAPASSLYLLIYIFRANVLRHGKTR
jgi:hypothetical protein